MNFPAAGPGNAGRVRECNLWKTRIKTVLLLAGLTVFLIFMGKLIGGRTGMYIAFILALAMNFFSYWFSDKIVLRMYGAQEVTPGGGPAAAPDGG